MVRHTVALEIRNGEYNNFRKALGGIWNELTALLDAMKIRNFSLWNIEHLVFGYYESEEELNPGEKECEKVKELSAVIERTADWICAPGQKMRLMYQDFGVVRESKELIRHRVFVTHLKPGMHEEYKLRHDRLVEARNGKISPGPDSNFSIWNGADYIFGYDEIDVTMENEETEASKQATIDWETKMLEIMDWYTDDVDWITGLHHGHIQRIGYHN